MRYNDAPETPKTLSARNSAIQNGHLTQHLSWRSVLSPVLPALALLVLLAACSGPAIPVPAAPTRDASKPIAPPSHQHGGDGGNGQLITVYGGALKSNVTTEPAAIQSGAPFTITYALSDGNGAPVAPEALQVTHEKLMHLIVVSKDLQQFAHIHPLYTADGRYVVSDTLPTSGDYLLFNEFFTSNGKMQIERNPVSVTGGPVPDHTVTLTPDIGQPKLVDGLRVLLQANPEKIRRRGSTVFTLSVSKDGKPVTTLEPYLGAPAHVVMISADTMQFAHTHGDAPGGAMSGDMGNIGMGGMVMPTPAPHYGPELQFTHTFMQPGIYRIWVQFGYEGRVVTAGYTLEVFK